jgi:short-subunit dehydrogenase
VRELEQVRLLVEAPVALTSAFLPAMVERGRGAILNVASTAGMQPLPYSAGYSAAKAYVLTFSEALHQEVRGSGVTVTALAPGPVTTEFWDVAGWQAGGQAFEKAVPRPAWVTAEETAKAGVKGLADGSRVVVPGLQIRTAMLAARYVPHAIKLPAIERVLRRR